MKRSRRASDTVSRSISPEPLREADRKGRTKAGLSRRGQRGSLAAARLRSLQAYGTWQARKHRIAESDVERLIQEHRAARDKNGSGRTRLRRGLKEGAMRRAQRDRQIAADWFAVDVERATAEKRPTERKRGASRSRQR